jgi:hypothetical protein
MTDLQNFYKLYQALEKGIDENLMDIFESLEVIQPVINKWLSSDFLSMASYISDDTTSGRAFELQKHSRKLGSLIDKLLEEYLGISDEEAEILLESVKHICEDLAVIHFSTDRYSEYIESIQNNTFSLENIEMSRYVAEIAAQGGHTLIEDIRVTAEILVAFEVYLPEYTLSEDDLDALMEYMEENDIGAYEIGTMSRRAVKDGLYDS